MKYIQYRSGYKYQLAADYSEMVDIRPQDPIDTEFISLTPDGMLYINQGYAWDGPSGPTIDTRNFMRGSLVHDALYQLIRENHLPAGARAQADAELKRICRKDGMCKIRAWYVYRGVRRAAGFAADPRHRKIVRIAP